MAEFTAADVKRLRDATGAGMMDCKKALTEADGDYDKAVELLRVKGAKDVGKRLERSTTNGVVVSKDGALLELDCETDFVAKNADFVNLVNELANIVAQGGEGAADEKKDEIESLNVSLKENIQLGRVVRFENTGKDVDSYLHVQADRGVNAVLVEVEGGSQELAHDIAVHIAFARPQYLSRDEVPAEEVEQQKKTFEAISRNEGKPEAALPKIIEGRLQGFYKDMVLVDQPYAKDEKQNIAQLLGSAKVTRFAQVVVGT